MASALVHIRQASAFLVIGGVAFFIDAAVFNVLVYWGGQGPMFSAPIPAKIIAIAVASVFTYFGNRHWTFRERQTPTTVKRSAIFALLTVAAILIQLGCLGFSRYVLGLQDPVSDNVSGTLIGQVFATAFRYVTYGRWVFPDERPTAPLPDIDAALHPDNDEAA
jgi:putative flippase GtrA